MIAAFFQAIPGAVVFGATLLMFGLVAVSGLRVIQAAGPDTRDWVVVAGSLVLGYGIALFADQIPGLSALSPELLMILQFPVSTGAMVAVLLELFIPRFSVRQSGA